MGKEVILEMNRVGMIIDMSHSSAKSTLQAIELSSRPISITHANPSFWHSGLRNKSDNVLKSLFEQGGMLGFSLYPHHLKGGTNCKVDDFCNMIAETAEKFGTDNIGIGSDLCQDQPDTVVEWMRNGRWTRTRDFGEGDSQTPGFPKQPEWFKSNVDFVNLIGGLKKTGFSKLEVANIMGKNWLRFFEASFSEGKY
jgi:microsomal dipeptidase-like Zn-dependent dipeptidase